MPETTEQIFFDGFCSSAFQDYPDFQLNEIDRLFWDQGKFYGERYRMDPEAELLEAIELEEQGLPDQKIKSATRF